MQAMESKLLVGGKNIVDHTNEQQRALEQRRREISDQKVGGYQVVAILSNLRHLFHLNNR